MDIINSSPQQPVQNQPEPATETPPEPQPQVHKPVVGQVHHKPKMKSIVRVVLTLVIAALAAAGVYFWQQGKNSDLQSQLNAKKTDIDNLRQAAAEIEAAKKADTSNTQSTTNDSTTNHSQDLTNRTEDLIAGDVDVTATDGKVMVNAIFKYSLGPSAVWVEYGTSPTKLDKSTVKNTKSLDEGDPDAVYSTGEYFFIDNTQLTPGTTYYYRTAATVGGKTLYSASASFVTKK